jgi:hypothetical protein
VVLLIGAVLVLIPLLMMAPEVNALAYGKETNLSSSDASFLGPYPGWQFGESVDIVGDVNGDGYDDIAVGAPNLYFGGAHRGQVFIFFGGTEGWTTNMSAANADASYVGEAIDDMAGSAVAGAGDVNGDGFDDFLVGVPINGEHGRTSGQTYLILGRTSGWGSNMSLSRANASFRGEYRDDRSGIDVAGCGDVNGDGFDDFLVGATGNDDGGIEGGKCYLIFGRSSGWAMDTNLSRANASYYSEGAYSMLFTVAGAGDVNGDGFDDFMMGARAYGLVYLVMGRPGNWTTDVPASQADASFYTDEYNDGFGMGIAGVGDVDGDGLDDLAMGAYASSDPIGSCGKVYLFLGKVSGWMRDTNASKADATWSGEASHDLAGRQVRGAGDVDGDGFDDFIVAGNRYDASVSDEGKVYLILGRADGWTRGQTLSDADVSFVGEIAADQAGRSLGGGGDVDGDGYDDIVVGVPENDQNGYAAGKAYLVFPDSNVGPRSVTNISLYRNNDLVNTTEAAYMEDVVHVVMTGVDGNSSRRDLAEVDLWNVNFPIPGFTLRLRETDVDSGVYYGNFTIKNRTHEGHRWMGTRVHDTVIVAWTEDHDVWAECRVSEVPVFDPMPGMVYTQEDHHFSINFTLSQGDYSSWSVRHTADWLESNPPYMLFNGTPTNADVGTYWINVTVREWLGTVASLNVTVVVNNSVPRLTTLDVLSVNQDGHYLVDYDSDDDGQGNITWYMETNASWLSFNDTTGVLLGTPSKHDVGEYFVNVTVHDGNDGWNFTNFTLVVINVEDPPEIVTIPPGEVTEDTLYHVGFHAEDPDPGDRLTWSLVSDIVWLGIDPATGVLRGTPSNADVGTHQIIVRVDDLTGGYDVLNFTLVVQNINDPPRIITEGVVDATEDLVYGMVIVVEDVDVGDWHMWTFLTNASWLEFKEEARLLSGEPTNEDVGEFFVNLTVRDRAGDSDTRNYTLVVLNVNDRPRLESSLPPTVATVGVHYEYQVNATDDDQHDVLLYSIVEGPMNLTVDGTSGVVSWVPAPSDVGDVMIVVNVSDGAMSVYKEWSVTVRPANTDPTITGEPPSKRIIVGETFVYQVEVWDPDDAESLTYQLVVGPDGLTLDPVTGLMEWAPTSGDVGTHPVSLRVLDSRGGLSEQSFDIEVTEDDGKEPVDEDASDVLVILLIIAIAVTVGGLLIWRRTRG